MPKKKEGFECPLTRKEQWKLINTYDRNLTKEFPDYSRAELRKWKTELRDGRLGFLLYLVKGRTEEEMSDKFPKWEAYLEEGYEGYNLFITRDQYNQKVYILLPKHQEEVVVQERLWSYSQGSDGDLDQPYLIVQMPNEAFDDDGVLRIAPLFDVHYGHGAHRHEKFLSYLRWIEETENVYVVVGGDLMENALDDGRGMSYDQTSNPSNQMNEMVRLLAPIAHKILLMTPGNHEWRTYKKSGIDPMMVIADRLGVPYFSGPVFLDILANTYRWAFHIFHGRGGSRTKGGKMNAAARPKKFTGLLHFIISGHTHDPMVNSETLLIQDPVNVRLMKVPQWIVVAQAFLEWEWTYAYRAGYSPPGRGGVTIELCDNGDYRASLV